VKPLLSKYFPFFLAYLFWSLAALFLIGGGIFYARLDEQFWQPETHNTSTEKRLKNDRAMLNEIFFKGLSMGWYFPLLLTVTTACVLENLPDRRGTNV